MGPPPTVSRARFLRLAGAGGLTAGGLAGVSAAVPVLLPDASAAPTAKRPRPADTSSAAHTWKNVFTDDFTGSTLDRRWMVFSGKSGTSYGHYNRSHVRLSGGNLVIYGERDQVGGVGLFGAGAPKLRYAQVIFTQRTYKVGLSNTDPSFADVSLMWPADNDRRHNPELDIRETSHPSLTPVQQSFHYADTHAGSLVTSTAVSGGSWHEYTVEMTPDGVTYRVDGRVTLASSNSGVRPAGPMWFGCQVENDWKDTSVPPAGGRWVQETARIDINALVK